MDYVNTPHMADNSYQDASPIEPSGDAADQQHIFESALLVDPSASAPTLHPSTPEAAAAYTISESAQAEAATMPPPETQTSGVAAASDIALAAAGDSTQPPPPRRSHTILNTGEPRHCWICLTDEGVDSSTNDWRSPCPCNLTAHEDCLLQWISEMESSARKEGTLGRQKIECPQCKNEIKVERPTEFLVLLEELLSAVARQVMLPAGFMMLGGIVYSGSMVYGFNVLELVFGPDGGRCLFAGIPAPMNGSRALIERAPRLLKRIFDVVDSTLDLMFPFWPKSRNDWLYWLSPLIGPTLLLSRTGYADKVFGTATLPSLMILSYQTLVDPRNSPIFAWPPTPGLALLSLPYIRTIYNEAYAQLFAEHEKRWRLAIQRHPREGETAEEIAAAERVDGVQMGDHVLGIEIELVQEEEPVPARAQGPNDLAEYRRNVAALRREVDELNQLRPGAIPDERVRLLENMERVAARVADRAAEGQQAQDPERNAEDQAAIDEMRRDMVEMEEAQDAAARAANERVLEGQVPAAEGRPATANMGANAQANPGPAPDAAAAPPAGRDPNGWEFRQNVSVFAVARTVVATLLFPAASSVVGNILEVILPKTWVTRPSIPMSTGGFLAGAMSLWSGKQANVGAGTWKRGLLQEKWGRTIVGGMIVVGVKDAVSLYVLWRRAKIEGQRKVLNYEGRNRRGRRERSAAAGTESAAAAAN